MKRELKEIGQDVYIHDDVLIKHDKKCSIGSHVAIDKGCKISTIIEIGDYVHIAPDVVTIGGEKTKVTLNHFSFIAAGTKIVCGSEDYTGKGLVGPTIPLKYRELIYGDVTFEKYAGCGVNCSIMPGVTFGEGAILGANSLATKDLEPWTIYVGSPAKPVKKRDKDIIIKNAKELGYEL
jgi:galactoside O-acetyltransferase